MLTAPIGRTIIGLAAPNVISMIVLLITLVAEAWYIGQMGTVALAGLALVFPMFMLIMMLSAGSVGGAITGVVAQQLGAGNRSGAEVLAFHAVLLAVLLAAICGLIFLTAGGWAYSALGGSGAVLDEALLYSDLFFTGCLSMWLANALAAIARATGHMKVVAICLITGSVVQLVAGGLLIFGLGFFPKMGMSGAAAAAVIGYSVGALMLLYFLMMKCAELRLTFSGIAINLMPLVNILRVGALSSVNPFCTWAAVIAITAFMARYGVDTLAGYGIGARLEFLLIPLIFGFGAASTAMVGIHFGAKRIQRAHRVGLTASFISAGIAGVIGITVAVFPGIWANAFTDVEAVRMACRTYLQIVGPFYAFFAVALCLYFASQGAGRVLWPVIGVAVRFAIVIFGGLILVMIEEARIEPFFTLIAAGMAAQGILTGLAIHLGAWTRNLDEA